MVNSKSFASRFFYEPFKTMDNIHPKLFGREFNPFVKFRLNRKIAFSLAMISGLFWLCFGFDSCIAQPLMLLYRSPEYFLGQISFNTLVQETWINFYGKEMHYSAFLFYGLAYWFLSRHFEKNLGIVKSKNVAYTMSFVLLSVAAFEWFWIGSYAHFQNQAWVISWKFPQAKILIQNLGFTTLGVLGVLYVWADSYSDLKPNGKRDHLFKFNLDKIALVLIVISICSAVFWWAYPFHVEKVNVTLETGEVWSNSNNFPQTLYTVDLNPNDSLNAGEWFFVENNLIHGVNTLVKLLWTLTFVYIGRVKSLKR